MYAVKFPMFQQPHSDYALLRNQLTTICKNQWSVIQDDTGVIVCSHTTQPTKHIVVRRNPDARDREGAILVSVSINDTHYLQNFRGQMEAYEYLEDYIGVDYPVWPPDTDNSEDERHDRDTESPHRAVILGKRKRECRG